MPQNYAQNAEALTKQMEQVEVTGKFTPELEQSQSLPNKSKTQQKKVPLNSPEPKRSQNTPNKLKTQREKMPLNSLRFNGLQHDIEFDDPNEPRKGYRSKKEGCGLPTIVYCDTCKVHLCFVTGKNGWNCFKKFHKLNES